MDRLHVEVPIHSIQRPSIFDMAMFWMACILKLLRTLRTSKFQRPQRIFVWLVKPAGLTLVGLAARFKPPKIVVDLTRNGGSMSPYIASCMLVDRSRREPSELEVLSRQLSSIEAEKYVRRSPKRRSLVSRVAGFFGGALAPRWDGT